MTTSCHSTLAIGLSALLTGCDPKEDDSPQPASVPAFPGKPVPPVGNTGLPDSLIPDSINTYRPELGRAATVRQFPFNSASPPTAGLKLSSILYNGKTVRTHQYDEQGRLAQRKDCYTNGVQIFRQFSCACGMDGVTEVAQQLNKEAPVVEGYPRRSDLLPSAPVMFARPASTAAGNRAGFRWELKQRKVRYEDAAYLLMEIGREMRSVAISPWGHRLGIWK